jgi:phage terminase small subunit
MSKESTTLIKPLTAKQEAFVAHYLRTWNATESARAAGYPERSARQIGSENLSKPGIQAAIRERLNELHMSADEVLSRVTAIARGSLAPFLRRGTEGDLIGFDLSDDQSLGLLKKASVTERRLRSGDTERTVTIELYDAQAALTKLGEHHKLWGDKSLNGLMKLIDLNKLTPDQLERIANGDDPLAVLLTPTQG